MKNAEERAIKVQRKKYIFLSPQRFAYLNNNREAEGKKRNSGQTEVNVSWKILILFMRENVIYANKME